MQNTVEVKAQELSQVFNITKVNMRVMEYILKTSCTVFYQLVDETGASPKSGIIKIEGDEFREWGTDDTYIENLILTKLGYNRSASV
jgi:hypothetical protein